MSATPSSAQQGGITGRHVLFAVVGFFAVVFAVNGYFLYAALATHTGVVSVQPYVKGLHYNERIAAQEQQNRLGWQVSLDDLSLDGALRARFTDAAGLPLNDLDVAATLGRPSTDRHDRSVIMKGHGNGRYEAALAAIEPGAWLLSLEATHNAGAGRTETYRLRRRLWLKP